MNSLKKPLITPPKNAELDSSGSQTPANTMANVPVSEKNYETCEKITTCVCITGCACCASFATVSVILSLFS